MTARESPRSVSSPAVTANTSITIASVLERSPAALHADRTSARTPLSCVCGRSRESIMLKPKSVADASRLQVAMAAAYWP